MSKVVVVGGGYAGTMVAKALDPEAELILIDPRDSFVNVSSSMRALVRPDWADRPFFAYDRLLDRGRIVRGSVTSADAAGVTLASGERVNADYLVLATGSAHAYPARPHLPETSATEAARDLRATGQQLVRAGRVLIIGGGPVGLELAGEIREAWPDKHVTIIDRSSQALPGYLPEVREQLHRQLDGLGIELRLGTAIESMPDVPDGVATAFAVQTTDGEAITADIWFRCFGSQPNTGFLDDGALTELTERHTVAVDGHLNVVGHPRVYALGDIAELPDAKMATWAQTQAPTVIENILAQLRGGDATSVYEPDATPRLLLPLGSRFGVGQLPSPDGGSVPAPVEAVVQRKGTDLFTARFAERFGS
ncbi:pyridine nucleotide-disulfide oxidoreductase [Microlunatus endophyticus]|uniref:Pyridine nucleotide-disulfide oxidoreductase n=1 Tax=Microlunatus endophyticus TaxID=1716077 RepID=A0A917S693_9ACTN|nr:FAD-dependent oxidoreductase [Microlunatus endophyticus]GGL60060.1 pyridine nucleotide-disulfide oxidoreductase [Microlunatus endophyticus]